MSWALKTEADYTEEKLPSFSQNNDNKCLNIQLLQLSKV